ncbi:MAG: hypothetical protein ACSLFH_00475 [Desulfuromonadales bacterium]
MNKDELTSLCQEVETGQNRFVQNLESLYAGKVVACGDNGLTVEVFGRRFDWNAEHCRQAEPTINPLGPSTNK